MSNRVALIAMGCEKNVINSEQMLYLLDRAGFELVGDPAEADVTVVNTCGFIGDARREALEQLREASESGTKVILAGCYAEWLKRELASGLAPGRLPSARADGARTPEICGYIGAGRFDDVAEAVRAVLDGQSPLYFGGLDEPVSETPRIHTGAPHTAYLKIAEGCDNHCSYCAIPSLRGPFRSRRPEAVAAEAAQLCARGVKELILVAQDVTRYGADLYGSPRLARLLETLCRTEGLTRLRLHYLYPEPVGGDLIEVIAANPIIARYMDIPIQHASDPLLKAMNRRYTRSDLLELFGTLRERIPGVVLRTSIIVGFPGETQADFDTLMSFLEEAQIPRAGVFAYSREAGTPAAAMPGHIPSRVKRQRRLAVERLQSRVTDRFNKAREGTVAEVLCEGFDRFAGVYYGRSEAESPEVDGYIFFTSGRAVEPGETVKVFIDGSIDGDGRGRAI